MGSITCHKDICVFPSLLCIFRLGATYTGSTHLVNRSLRHWR